MVGDTKREKANCTSLISASATASNIAMALAFMALNLSMEHCFLRYFRTAPLEHEDCLARE